MLVKNGWHTDCRPDQQDERRKNDRNLERHRKDWQRDWSSRNPGAGASILETGPKQKVT